MIGKTLSGARVILLVALMVAFPLRAKAVTTLFVSSTSGSDANPCTSGFPCMTIGRAISLAGSGDTINVAAGPYSTPNEVFPLTINLALTITGAGASSTIIDAQKTNRVISFTGTGNLSISGVTIQGGKAPGTGNGGGIFDNSTATLTLADSVVTGNAADDGGGIAEEAGGTVNLTDCTVSKNTSDDDGGGIAELGGGTINLMKSTISDNRSALDGGGIAEEGSGAVHLINSTVSGNSTDGFGGGIAADGGGIITMNNCTISNNRASNGGGGLDNNSGDTVTLANTIVADNVPGGDCATASGSSITSNGHNLDSDGTCGLSTALGDLINKNPRLGPLALNPPGTTATRGLIVGSPAIDAGDPGPSDGIGSHCEPTDQRGVTRPQGPACDIGAFEGQIQPPSNTGAPALGVSGLLLMILGLATLGARRLRYRTANASGRTA